MSKLRRVHIRVSGRVQGVSYREHTRQAAVRAGLSGWVKNLSDGRVEALLEGESESVEAVIEVMRRGPTLARVEGVELEEETPTAECSTFRIVRE